MAVKKIKKTKIKINNKNKNKNKIVININSHNKKKVSSNKQPKTSNIQQQQQQPSIIINNPFPVSSQGVFSNEYGIGLSREIDSLHHGMTAIKLQNDEIIQNRLNNEILNKDYQDLVKNRINHLEQIKKKMKL